jgi:hypothetical protein
MSPITYRLMSEYGRGPDWIFHEPYFVHSCTKLLNTNNVNSCYIKIFQITLTEFAFCESEFPLCQAKCWVTTELDAIKVNNSKAPEQRSEGGSWLAVGPLTFYNSINNVSIWNYDVYFSKPDKKFLYCFTFKFNSWSDWIKVNHLCLQMTDARSPWGQNANSESTLNIFRRGSVKVGHIHAEREH